MKLIPIKLFAACFSISFLWISGLVVTRGTLFAALNTILVVLLSILFFALAFFLMRQSATPTPAARARLSVVLFLLAAASYLVLQCSVGYTLRTIPSTNWDFDTVFLQAGELVTNGTPTTAYFAFFPNNKALFLVLVGLFKVSNALGARELGLVGIGFNVLMIDLSIVVTYLVAKEFASRRKAGAAAVIMLFLTLPLLVYTPLFYTDTLTALFPILAIYCWILAKRALSESHTAKAVWLIAVAALSASLGALLKISVAIVAVAIILDALLQLKGWRSIAAGGICILVFFASFAPSNDAIRSNRLFVQDNISYKVPWTHWVMMGLRGNGGYYDPDYQLVLEVPGEEREEFIAAEIARRVKAYGVSGMIGHLNEKASFTWGEGTFFSSLKVRRSRAASSSLDKYIEYNPDDQNNKVEIYAYYCEGLMLFFVAMFTIAGVRLILEREFREKMLPLALSIFGLFLFLLIWEARSRYLVNWLPLFALLSLFTVQWLIPKKIKIGCLKI